MEVCLILEFDSQNVKNLIFYIYYILAGVEH